MGADRCARCPRAAHRRHDAQGGTKAFAMIAETPEEKAARAAQIAEAHAKLQKLMDSKTHYMVEQVLAEMRAAAERGESITQDEAFAHESAPSAVVSGAEGGRCLTASRPSTTPPLRSGSAQDEEILCASPSIKRAIQIYAHSERSAPAGARRRRAHRRGCNACLALLHARGVRLTSPRWTGGNTRPPSPACRRRYSRPSSIVRACA